MSAGGAAQLSDLRRRLGPVSAAMMFQHPIGTPSSMRSKALRNRRFAGGPIGADRNPTPNEFGT
jgi:hypothetical protein